ncbi:hypothetical protein AKO1_002814 [Acrasis kona]|uniref:Uncharacterized protein n=1 Tax=Acrasis kona TaxID=1008807 RepID=A0AAW2YWG0_9EUKA
MTETIRIYYGSSSVEFKYPGEPVSLDSMSAIIRRRLNLHDMFTFYLIQGKSSEIHAKNEDEIVLGGIVAGEYTIRPLDEVSDCEKLIKDKKPVKSHIWSLIQRVNEEAKNLTVVSKYLITQRRQDRSEVQMLVGFNLPEQMAMRKFTITLKVNDQNAEILTAMPETTEKQYTLHNSSEFNGTLGFTVGQTPSGSVGVSHTSGKTVDTEVAEWQTICRRKSEREVTWVMLLSQTQGLKPHKIFSKYPVAAYASAFKFVFEVAMVNRQNEQELTLYIEYEAVSRFSHWIRNDTTKGGFNFIVFKRKETTTSSPPATVVRPTTVPPTTTTTIKTVTTTETKIITAPATTIQPTTTAAATTEPILTTNN